MYRLFFLKQNQHVYNIIYEVLVTDLILLRQPQFTNDIPSTVYKVRTRPTSKYLRHCLENHTGSHSRYRMILDDEGLV